MPERTRRGGFWSNSKPEEEARDEHMVPRVRQGLPEAGSSGDCTGLVLPSSSSPAGDHRFEREGEKKKEKECEGGRKLTQASHEYGSLTSKDVVHRLRQPAADDGAAEIRSRVAKANEPSGPLVVAADAELHLVEGLGAVHDGLVHTLDGRTEGADCRGREVVNTPGLRTHSERGPARRDLLAMTQYRWAGLDHLCVTSRSRTSRSRSVSSVMVSYLFWLPAIMAPSRKARRSSSSVMPASRQNDSPMSASCLAPRPARGLAILGVCSRRAVSALSIPAGGAWAAAGGWLELARSAWSTAVPDSDDLRAAFSSLASMMRTMMIQSHSLQSAANSVRFSSQRFWSWALHVGLLEMSPPQSQV